METLSALNIWNAGKTQMLALRIKELIKLPVEAIVWFTGAAQ